MGEASQYVIHYYFGCRILWSSPYPLNWAMQRRNISTADYLLLTSVLIYFGYDMWNLTHHKSAINTWLEINIKIIPLSMLMIYSVCELATEKSLHLSIVSCAFKMFHCVSLFMIYFIIDSLLIHELILVSDYLFAFIHPKSIYFPHERMQCERALTYHTDFFKI